MTAVSGRRWAVVAAASGTVLIGGGAFWLSFTALADLAVRSGIDAGLAWIWPLLVDGLLVVATVAAVALDGHRSAWYPWALLIAGAGMSVTANAAHAIVAATASVPALLAAVVAAVPPLVLLASTHLTVVLTRSTKTRAIKSPAGLPVTGPALTGTVSTGRTGHADPAQPPKLPEHPEPAATSEPETQPPALPEPQNKLQDEPTPKPSSGPDPTEPAPPKSGSPGRESLGAGLVRRERAVTLREAGWSNKAIARELGVHASTVGRWFPRASSGESETEMKKDEEKESDHEPQRA
ncbi:MULTISPECIES: helix-turn-helix domain-containing protein [Micrococcales]|uniref:helix-turn-helix domain-containing protein n=2 Tax=Actinomycetes TaxID=1760 RepID=UPI003CEDA9F4